MEDIHYKYPVQVGVHVDEVAAQFHGSIEEGILATEALSMDFANSIEKRSLKISPRARSSAPSRQQPRSLRRN